MIKNILKIASLLALSITVTACGDICEEKEDVVVNPSPVVVPVPIVITPPVVATPSPVVLPTCDNLTFVNCIPPEGMEICDLTSYIPCAVPTWIPKRPEPPSIIACPQGVTTVGCTPSPVQLPIRVITPIPNPVPPCVRNTNPLVLIAGVWTDNCGNKYGSTTP
jgi:hypothetical protein